MDFESLRRLMSLKTWLLISADVGSVISSRCLGVLQRAYCHLKSLRSWLFGKSGAGKTTLLSFLAQFLAGEIQVYLVDE